MFEYYKLFKIHYRMSEKKPNIVLLQVFTEVFRIFATLFSCFVIPMSSVFAEKQNYLIVVCSVNAKN